MSLEESLKAVLSATVDDFNLYASKILKIKSKTGQIVPFSFNIAQQYIHTKLEEQRAKTGMVRAVILKGRQQGCCYSPEMRVLTADYRWVKIKDLEVGERLIAVDEDTGELNSAGRRTERRLRTAVCEAKVEFKREAFKVVMDNGVELVVTGEHRHLCRKRGGDDASWRTVDDTRVGDVIRVFCHAHSTHEPTFEDGWFAGLLDGEGTFAASPQVRIGVSQIDGPVLRRAKKYLEDNGIHYYELIDRRINCGSSSKLGDKPVHCLRIDRQTDIVRLLSLTRPSRFIGRELFVGKKLPKTCDGFNAWAKVLSIIPVGIIPVVDIQTSEATFICEGLVSHNSTYVTGRFFWKTSMSFGKQTYILTHEQAATDNLFGMTNRYLENIPPELRPALGVSNAKELVFSGLDSGYKVATAGNRGAGRSATAQFLLGSEVAYWPAAEEHLAGIMQTIPRAAGTEIIFESTADGIGNVFHQVWQQGEVGEGGWQAIFVPWYWQQEYRAEGVTLRAEDLEYGKLYNLDPPQMMWRRLKINEMADERLFMKEYPSTPAEAFSVSDEAALIPFDIVTKARHGVAEAFGARVIGVDPARFGSDRTVIIIRQGRVAEILHVVQGKDTMQVVGLVLTFIGRYKPDAVFVDVGGLGAGIVDRFRELNMKVVKGVNFGEKSLWPDKYENKRAEMWAQMKDWLCDSAGVQIPDDDALQSDLCGIRYDYDSHGRLKLETKEEAKKRGIRSPDMGDAFALTWAMPVRKAATSDPKMKPYMPSVPSMGV